jgi:hypothetical protein
MKISAWSRWRGGGRILGHRPGYGVRQRNHLSFKFAARARFRRVFTHIQRCGSRVPCRSRVLEAPFSKGLRARASYNAMSIPASAMPTSASRGRFGGRSWWPRRTITGILYAKPALSLGSYYRRRPIASGADAPSRTQVRPSAFRRGRRPAPRQTCAREYTPVPSL